MRVVHHAWRAISSRQASEVFQSSRMSWSSKIIDVGTVENSQRSSGSDQLSA